MNMPRFNAEASVYRTSNTYQAVYSTLCGQRIGYGSSAAVSLR
jgi:hypothetical protein